MERKHFIALVIMLVLGLMMAIHFPKYVQDKCDSMWGSTPMEYKVEGNKCFVNKGEHGWIRSR